MHEEDAAMSDTHTVTNLLVEVCAGDEAAVEKLVHRYLDRLAAVGRQTYRQKFGDVPRPVEDEEDAALSALKSFWARASDGRVHHLANRQQLWSLLVKITIRKIYDQRERALAQKRGRTAAVSAADGLEQVLSQLPPPEAEAELEDTRRAALAALDDPALGDPKLRRKLRRIAEMDLEGRTRKEIAESVKLHERRVYGKLKLIREHWNQTFAADR
jgi:hypothetical protein